MILDRWGGICALLGSTHNLNVYAGLAMTMSDVQETIKIKTCNNDGQIAVLIL